MSRFEQIVEKLRNENEVPENVKIQFQNTLEALPEQRKEFQWKRYVAVVAMLLVCSGVVLMGGTALAAKLPFLGKIFAEVENLHFFFPDNYSDKAQVLEQMEATEAECEGIKITASEIYSDGFSVYVTAEIYVEAGGLNNIPGDIAHKSMYLMGTYQLEGNDTVFEMENDNLYGKVVDDHTFIGMTKLNLDDVYVENGVLKWNLTMIGYDDVTLDVNDIAHRVKGEWNLAFPVSVDTENTKIIEVDHSENGYTLEKVVVTPYQIATFVELPEEHAETYVVAFNQDRERIDWQVATYVDNGIRVDNLSVGELDISSLSIYVFDDMDLWLDVYKSSDMSHESVKEAMFSVEVAIE